MSDRVKRGEFVVNAESIMGVKRGLDLAYDRIFAGQEEGEQAIDKHGVSVKWRVYDSVVPSAAPPPLAEDVPAGPLVPDISLMDIADANGIVGTAGNIQELDDLEQVEINGTRTPGGRKGVLNFIGQRRDEFRKQIELAEEKAKKAAEDAELDPKEDPDAELAEETDPERESAPAAQAKGKGKGKKQ